MAVSVSIVTECASKSGGYQCRYFSGHSVVDIRGRQDTTRGRYRGGSGVEVGAFLTAICQPV